MKVWVTRDELPDGPLSTALRAVDLAVLHEPVLERNILTDATEQIAALTPDDWLVLTSVFAIEQVAAEVARVPRLAVVGDSSRRAAEKRGFRVALVGSGEAASLFEELFNSAACTVICYPRSSEAAVPLAPPGIDLVSPVMYQTQARRFTLSVLKEAEVVAVTSPTAVGAVGACDLPFASIGPKTSAALRQTGIAPWIEAPQRSFKSLAAAIASRGLT